MGPAKIKVFLIGSTKGKYGTSFIGCDVSAISSGFVGLACFKLDSTALITLEILGHPFFSL
jgi:hypothetical protein